MNKFCNERLLSLSSIHGTVNWMSLHDFIVSFHQVV